MRKRILASALTLCAAVLHTQIHAETEKLALGPGPRTIIGGEPASQQEFPWVVYIDTRRGFCSGALIRTTWVLTAAHCVVEPDGSVHAPYAIERGYPSEFEQNTAIGQVLVHPEYDFRGAGFKYDAALVELLRPFDRSSTVEVLSRAEDAEHVRSGIAVAGMGWGRKENDEWSDDLRHVGLTLWRAEDCRRRYEFSDEEEKVHSLTLCAVGVERGINSGDSGGPLLVDLGGSGLGWRVAGVASLSDVSGANRISIYTRASALQVWLERYLATTLVLPYVMAGSITSDPPSQVRTVVSVSNRAAASCAVDIQFVPTGLARPVVAFDGQIVSQFVFRTTVPALSATEVGVTAPGSIIPVTGSIVVAPESACSAASVNVEARLEFANRNGSRTWTSRLP